MPGDRYRARNAQTQNKRVVQQRCCLEGSARLTANRPQPGVSRLIQYRGDRLWWAMATIVISSSVTEYTTL